VQPPPAAGLHPDALVVTALVETRSHNRLLRLVQDDIDNLMRALKGTGPLSMALAEVRSAGPGLRISCGNRRVVVPALGGSRD
jgi:hypothetical protein